MLATCCNCMLELDFMNIWVLTSDRSILANLSMKTSSYLIKTQIILDRFGRSIDYNCFSSLFFGANYEDKLANQLS